jgi:hypothetical protein
MHSQHLPTDLAILPNQAPSLVLEYGHGAYEALHLARRTVQYFTRPDSELADTQNSSIDIFRNDKGGLTRTDFMRSLALPDSRGTAYAKELLEWSTATLNGIFFFGAIRSLTAS